MVLKYFWHCLFSPKLIKVYGGPSEHIYEPSSIEKFGDQILSSMYFVWNFGVYTSPFIAGFMYRRGYFVAENLAVFTNFFTSIGVILFMSLCMRGIGRANNEIYQKFSKTLRDAQKNMSDENKKLLQAYDFEFYAWPVEFQWSDIESKKGRILVRRSSSGRPALQWIMTLPCQVIGAIAIHTFGIRLIYPGSLSILQAMISSALLQGRSKLIQENNGQRFKLRSCDNNNIDSMFVDQRNKIPHGHILVICCEGNAGFYEIGIMGTPIAAGYSVLGWNHPGFGGSTGKPYPEQEQNAMDIVVQFAIHKLKFDVENIILFGWSIGGYTTCWAAMNYPNVKGVILDASFDDILPLAVQHTPTWTESIVRLAIRDHVNLNNYEQLCCYPGPVLLVRRTEDEVICTIENNISSNRGNFLLIQLLRYRYPLIFGEEQIQLVNEYLGGNISRQGVPDTDVSFKYPVDNEYCLRLLESYISEHSKLYPMKIGESLDASTKSQLAIFVVKKYMVNYKSTHCTPLPMEMFQLPWDINVDNDYVFT